MSVTLDKPSAAGKAAPKSGADAQARVPYRLISADQHVNEPPDLWTSRVEKKFKDRVPRMESFEKGDAWVIEGVPDPINFGMNSCAGKAPEEMNVWARWDSVRKGGYIGKERVAEMDRDGVDAAMMFPTPRLSLGIMNNPDRELSLAMVRAYNDWLSEYCSDDPERLFGLCLLPAVGVKEAIDELHRAMQLPGMIGPVINNYPHGKAEHVPELEQVWSAIVEMGVPLNIHVSLSDQLPGVHKGKVHGDMRAGDAMTRMQEFMFAGVLDRLPEFKVVFSEVDCGWVPFYKEQTDNRFHRLSKASGLGKRPPSEYFDQHYYYAFVSDAYAIKNRDAVGVENMLWSDDYPHLGGDWPYTQRTLVQSFSGVPAHDRDLIWAGNAMRLYNLQGRKA